MTSDELQDTKIKMNQKLLYGTIIATNVSRKS